MPRPPLAALTLSKGDETLPDMPLGRRSRSCLVVVVLTMLATAGGGCSDAPPATSLPTDAGSRVCTRDVECDDGRYCNGSERCVTAGDGGARGCAAGVPPCAGAGTICSETTDRCVTPCGDADGDDHTAITCGGDDCDDTDPTRYPGNFEVCDFAQHDEDCDGDTVGSKDFDRDGYSDAQCCNATSSGTVCGRDCDDTQRGTNPRVPEVCNGFDDDCDGSSDEGGVAVTGYPDRDRDGDGDRTGATSICAGRVSYVATGLDCNDDPAAGGRAQSGRTPEVIDGIDNDCNGVVDDVAGPASWYADLDGDGFGDPSGDVTASVVPVVGASLLALDCDDHDANVSPAADELCNGADDDCNGVADYPLGPSNTEDDDGDGVVDAACVLPAVPSDCDDYDPGARPGAIEACNARDDDCDGTSDEGGVCELPTMDAGAPDATVPDGGSPDAGPPDAGPADGGTDGGPPCITYYVDGDGDLYGDASDPRCDTVVPTGSTLTAGDCDDADGTRSPLARERINGSDDDCDTRVDEGIVTTASALAVGPYETCVRVDAAHWECAGLQARRFSTLTGSQMAIGLNLACAVDGGTVSCVDIEHGSTVPVSISGIVDAVEVHVGGDYANGQQFVCVLHASGHVSCWGSNSYGQLGDGSTTDRLSPVEPSGITDATALAVGATHACASRPTGVWCWGDGRFTQLTSAYPTGSPVPVLVVTVPGGASRLRSSGAAATTCALNDTGGIYCWGIDPYEIASGPSAYSGADVAVSSTLSCVARGGNLVECYGDNASGSWGNGNFDVDVHARSPVVGLSGAAVVAIGVRASGACVLQADGHVRCWGDNTYGQVGDGLVADSTTPISSTQKGLHTIAFGLVSQCALGAADALYCWGDNRSGGLGFGGAITAVLPSPTLAPVASAGPITIGGAAGYVVATDGTLMRGGLHATPFASGAVAVAASLDAPEHVCFARGDGTMACQGHNDYGQLGDGTTTDSSAPVEVPLTGVADVLARIHGTCARTSAGSVYCWGIGIGPTPVAVPGITTAVDVASADYPGEICAVLTSGRVSCWLPGGVPRIVSAVTSATHIAAGAGHTCVVQSSGAVLCWGANDRGQLGDGTHRSHTFPFRVAGITGATDVFAGGDTTCVRQGDLLCFGSNDWGQLGLGSLGNATARPVDFMVSR